MLVLYEQEEIEEKIAKQVPVIARKSTREKPQKRKRTGFLGLFGKKEEAFFINQAFFNRLGNEKLL